MRPRIPSASSWQRRLFGSKALKRARSLLVGAGACSYGRKSHRHSSAVRSPWATTQSTSMFVKDVPGNGRLLPCYEKRSNDGPGQDMFDAASRNGEGRKL